MSTLAVCGDTLNGLHTEATLFKLINVTSTDNLTTWCSASQLFVQHGAITFLAIIRKQQFSLLRSLCSCNNAVTQAFVSCDRFWPKWHSGLSTCELSLCAYFCFVFFVCFFVFFYLGLEPVS